MSPRFSSLSRSGAWRSSGGLRSSSTTHPRMRGRGSLAAIGANAPQVYNWASARLPTTSFFDGDEPTYHRRVLARRSLTRPDEIAYYFAQAPVTCTVADLARGAGMHLAIEGRIDCRKASSGHHPQWSKCSHFCEATWAAGWTGGGTSLNAREVVTRVWRARKETHGERSRSPQHERVRMAHPIRTWQLKVVHYNHRIFGLPLGFESQGRVLLRSTAMPSSRVVGPGPRRSRRPPEAGRPAVSSRAGTRRLWPSRGSWWGRRLVVLRYVG